MSYTQPVFSVLDTTSEHATSGPGKESATDNKLHGTRDALSTGKYTKGICITYVCELSKGNMVRYVRYILTPPCWSTGT